MNQRSDSDRTPVVETAPIILMVVLYLLVVVQNAWVCDDAYVSMRTIDNFVHGFGLRFNLTERVQAYTHPLWLGVVTSVYFFTREAYYTLVFPSVVFSALAFYLIVARLSGDRWMSVIAAAMLLLSRAFVDYSTSGLENPLTHLVLGVFLLRYFSYEEDRRRILHLALIASLGILNRMDTALLYLPALVFASWRAARWRGFRTAAAGLAPLVLWEAFSLVYYGFLFPNTAYAKLNTGIPRGELLAQGFYYFVDSIHVDPLTFFVILSVLALTVTRRLAVELPVVLGVGLYLLYILGIGGDFMSGRFFSAPLYVAVALLARWRFTEWMRMLIIGVVLLIGFAPLFHAASSRESSSRVNRSGIVDERRFYERQSSLTWVHRYAKLFHEKAEWSGSERATPVEEVKIGGSVGFFGFTEKPSTHILDFMGLADPLLSKLPAHRGFDWRIGHFSRKIPEGYVETIDSGTNRIRDEDLALYYEHLSRIVKGDVFSWQRLASVLRMNLGLLDHLIDVPFYRKIYSIEVELAELSEVKEQGIPWNAPGSIALPPRNGLLVNLPKVHHGRHLELGLEAGVMYSIIYYRHGRPLAYHDGDNRRYVQHRFPLKNGRGLKKNIVKVHVSIAGKGYDSFAIVPAHVNNKLKHSVGYVRLRK